MNRPIPYHPSRENTDARNDSTSFLEKLIHNMAEGFRKEMEEVKKSIQTQNQVNPIPSPPQVQTPQLQPLPLILPQHPTDTIQNTHLNNYTPQVPQLTHQMMPQVTQMPPWSMMPLFNPQSIC